MLYTLYIDESGDVGIGNVRTGNSSGASPYLTMGAVLVPKTIEPGLITNLDDLKSELSMGRALHCRTLTHEQKVRFSKFLNQQNVHCFGVISLKDTLGGYATEINHNHAYYYNKCSQYLLERVAHFAEVHGIPRDNIEIIFEHGNFDYNALRGLIATCQRNPIHPNTRRLNRINVLNIDSKPKADAPLLQLADLVAHSLYKCVDGGIHDVHEYRYLDEMKAKFFACSVADKIIGHGIYPVHNLGHLNLTDESQAFLGTL